MFRRLRAAAPVKKAMILSWSHIRLNMENVSQLKARMLL